MENKNRLWVVLGAAALVILLVLGAYVLFGDGKGNIDENKNLLYNSSFEEIGYSGAPEGWIEGKWYRDEGVSVLELSDEAYSGEYSVMVYNVDENDARFTQTIAVEPDSYYRLSCMVKAEKCGAGRNGAGISIENTFVSSDYVYDTNGEWVPLTLYGKTGADQKYITVMARVGGYGSLNTGRAWFDDLELVQLRQLPAGAVSYSFATHKPASAEEEEPAPKKESDGQGTILLGGALFALLMAAVMVFMKGRVSEKTARMTLIGGCAVALIARIICAMSMRGYEVDMNCFTIWSSWMANEGANFYNMGWCDYPPLYMMVLGLLGGLRNLLGLYADGPALWLLFKSVPIACDFAIGLFIWKIGKKKVGAWQATMLALMYLLNPAAIVNSAAWGQVDAVLTLLLLLCVYYAVRGHWIPALSIYAVAVLTKPQALMFGPIGLLAVVCAIWSAYKAWNEREFGYRYDKDFMYIVKHPDSSEPASVLTHVALGIAAMVLILLGVLTPFALAQGKDPFTWAWELYGGTLGSYPHITINACNLYSLLGKNWVALEDAGWLTYLAWGMYGLAFVYSFVLYIRAQAVQKNRNTLFLVCAVMLSFVFAFGAKMHERYLHPVLGLLLAAYVMHKDWRILLSMLLLTLGQYINGALVLRNEHLQAAQGLINGFAAWLNIGGALVTAWAGWDICMRGKVSELPEPVETMQTVQTAEGMPVPEHTPRRKRRTPIVPENYHLNLNRRDAVIVLAITLIYSIVAFTNLGSMKAPETAWTSSRSGETVVFDLGEVRTFNMTYYGGICNSSFNVSFSEDGEVWTEQQLAVYDQGQIFRWLWFVPTKRNMDSGFSKLYGGYPMHTARYVEIKAERAGLVLHEFGFLDENREVLPIASVMSYGGDGTRTKNPALLTDEQDTVAAYPSYYNSTYFDEIYHARTAYEHLHGMYPYETTHPPLGKVFIMLGIQLFGMTPFGWRFMGALFGCMMLPVMYLLAKQLFKKTGWATFATLLLALDCMHFTQTRIATIDTYGVFFILLMYWFMFRYCQMNFFTDDFKKTLIPLGLCGISMGLGIASKWICIYAAVGLAILFFYTLIRRYMEYRSATIHGAKTKEEERALKNFWKYFWITGVFCVVFFIVIPLLIYYFSYYWYMQPMGGLSVKGVWKEQLGMFNYHSGLTNDNHSFASPWHEWPLIERPMWFYSGTEFMPSGWVSSISCMGNPAVWWVGAAAMAFVLIRFVLFWIVKGLAFGYEKYTDRMRRRYYLMHEADSEQEMRMFQMPEQVKQIAERGMDRKYWYIVLGFAAQYVPWMLVPRSMFIYHYFASVPFIILATVMVYRLMSRKCPAAAKTLMAVQIVASVVLFCMFYPLMSGTPVLRSFAMYLRWFNWYNF